MIVINFYFTNLGGWIEYFQNGQTIKELFDTSESLYDFIKNNNLPLTYSGCVNCED
jgi:hypothetical protein